MALGLEGLEVEEEGSSRDGGRGLREVAREERKSRACEMSARRRPIYQPIARAEEGKKRDGPSYRCETVMAISTSLSGWILPSKSRMKCW